MFCESFHRSRPSEVGGPELARTPNPETPPVPTDNLPLLQPDPQSKTAIQRTTLAIDVLGRFLCNTLDEAIFPSRAPEDGPAPFDLTAGFDAIVVGSGMYGAYCAHRLWRNGAKVLVLEAGPFLISEHYQNLSNVGLGVGANVDAHPGPNSEADRTTDVVWGMPWRGNQQFGRQAFCVGGKSIFWGGWSPRLTDDVLAGPFGNGAAWPQSMVDYLKKMYERVELQMGVKELVPVAGQPSVPTTRTDLFNNPNNLLNAALVKKLSGLVGDYEVQPGGGTEKTTVERIEPAPIAVQADAPGSGLFSFDKFSSLALLMEAVREDAGRAGSNDQHRRLFVVPNVRVLRLEHDPAGNRAARVVVAGHRPIEVPAGCQVVLALGAIESTRLALDSFGGLDPINRLAGRNLMAHLRNNFTVRVRRQALGVADGAALQTAAFHVACKASTGGGYHFQFYAGFQPGPNAEAVLYRMIPDIESVEQQLANQDPDWVAITFRGCGEMAGRPDVPAGDPAASHVTLSNELDQHGRPRALANLFQQPTDFALFHEMDQAMFAIARGLAGDPADPATAKNIEYWDDQEKQWRPVNPYAFGGDRYGKLTSERGIRDSIGSTYHDSGTLWMGDDPNRSVTDPTGRFHRVPNVSCVDQAVFPRVGSANPVPTGLLVARRAAESLTGGGLEVVEELDGGRPILFHRAEPGFAPLFKFDRDALLPRGWEHRGAGGFGRFGLVLETAGGIGMLVHTAEEFRDFTLRLQWRAPTVRNNSGVHVRLPSVHLGDFDKLLKTGYEVQIDNTGNRPADQPEFPHPEANFVPIHQTGAIYPVHNKRKRPDESIEVFPAEADLPERNGHPSITPIPTRALEAWNDMEVLAAGDRLRVVLNGVSVLEGGTYTDQRSKYESGLIGLQNHFKGFRVQFRHVRIRTGTPAF